MPLKYYNVSNQNLSSASSVLVDQFYALTLEQFYISSDIYDIQEEYVFASGSYVNSKVRVNGTISMYTGEKLGDDFKTILFRDPQHPIEMGKKFFFDDNYWIVYNSESIKSLTTTCTVRRCNNVLRWTDTSGNVFEEPCSIEYRTNNPRNDVPKDNMPVLGGYTKIYTQLNSSTSTIRPNQRFLFGKPGNWTCMKAFPGSFKNYLNQKTLDNDSATLLIIEAEGSFENEYTDNLVLGIADQYKYTTSASSINNIIVSPNDGNIIEDATQIFDVRYYSGSVVVSGSFIFSVSGSNVPVENYQFSTIDQNSFSIINVEKYLDEPLIISCNGTSGSRTFNINLRGGW